MSQNTYNPEFEIRKLNENDYEQYYNLINMFRPTTFTIDDYLKTLKLIKEHNSDIWVIDLNGVLVGTATILYEYKFIHNISKIAHIEDVCINTNYRGKGYGKKLLNYLINEAKNNNCYKVTLYCNDELEEFYNTSSLEKKGIQMAKYI
jgi:glucosamine-phosphate N-acetyltransferase